MALRTPAVVASTQRLVPALSHTEQTTVSCHRFRSDRVCGWLEYVQRVEEMLADDEELFADIDTSAPRDAVALTRLAPSGL